MIFRDLIIDWSGSSPKLAYTTKATYDSGIKNYISKYFGTMLIKDCKTSTIYNFISNLRSDYELSDKTIYNPDDLMRYTRKRRRVQKKIQHCEISIEADERTRSVMGVSLFHEKSDGKRPLGIDFWQVSTPQVRFSVKNK